jgi:thiol-disulfide isomerase/thioredoxin
MMRRILFAATAAVLMASLGRASQTPSLALEQQLAEATQSERVTVVHFWAPWCPNCKAELAHGGWSGFIAANPGVNFVFVTLWSPLDGRELLERNGVGAENNFQLLLHPNGSRERGQKVSEILGLPISWIPTTWVFRDGTLRYAMNYGELHFPVLGQLIRDASDSWDH